MKILITGCAGFIGSNLVKASLELGHSVRVLDNFAAGSRDNLAGLAGIRKIVYASSSSVYGDSPVSVKREADRGRPLSPYAASKQGIEDFAHGLHQAYGLTLVGLRY